MNKFRKAIIKENENQTLSKSRLKEFEKFFKITEKKSLGKKDKSTDSENECRDRILIKMEKDFDYKDRYYLWHLAKYIKKNMGFVYMDKKNRIKYVPVSKMSDPDLTDMYSKSKIIKEIYKA